MSLHVHRKLHQDCKNLLLHDHKDEETARTTSTVKRDKKHAISYVVHTMPTPPRPPLLANHTHTKNTSSTKYARVIPPWACRRTGTRRTATDTPQLHSRASTCAVPWNEHVPGQQHLRLQGSEHHLWDSALETYDRPAHNNVRRTICTGLLKSVFKSSAGSELHQTVLRRDALRVESPTQRHTPIPRRGQDGY